MPSALVAQRPGGRFSLRSRARLTDAAGFEPRVNVFPAVANCAATDLDLWRPVPPAVVQLSQSVFGHTEIGCDLLASGKWRPCSRGRAPRSSVCLSLGVRCDDQM